MLVRGVGFTIQKLSCLFEVLGLNVVQMSVMNQTMFHSEDTEQPRYFTYETCVRARDGCEISHTTDMSIARDEPKDKAALGFLRSI